MWGIIGEALETLKKNQREYNRRRMAMCGECNWPVDVEMTPEEVERLNSTEQGQMFHFRGKDYLYAGRHSRKCQRVLCTESETFIVTERK